MYYTRKYPKSDDRAIVTIFAVPFASAIQDIMSDERKRGIKDERIKLYEPTKRPGALLACSLLSFHEVFILYQFQRFYRGSRKFLSKCIVSSSYLRTFDDM